MVRSARVERATVRLEGGCSIQLSYERNNGVSHRALTMPASGSRASSSHGHPGSKNNDIAHLEGQAPTWLTPPLQPGAHVRPTRRERSKHLAPSSERHLGALSTLGGSSAAMPTAQACRVRGNSFAPAAKPRSDLRRKSRRIKLPSRIPEAADRLPMQEIRDLTPDLFPWEVLPTRLTLLSQTIERCAQSFSI